MRFAFLWALAVGGVIACSGGSTPDTPNGTSSGSTGTVPLPGGGTCGADKVCLDVPPEKNTPAFRVAVYWFQLDDDGPDPEPQITYDQPVAAGTTRIEIPIASIPAPTDEKLHLCERATDDEAVSPCLSDPKVTYGIIVAYRDDGDGTINLQKDDTKDERVGYGNLVMGYAPTASPRGTAPKNAETWDRLWPDGVKAGVNLYQIERLDGDVFDRPINSPSGTINRIQERAPNVT